MNFYQVIGAFEDADIPIRNIYWGGSEEHSPDLIIQTPDGPKHVRSVTFDKDKDEILVEVG